MQAQDVHDVLALHEILEAPWHDHTPEGKANLITALVEWRNNTAIVPPPPEPATTVAAPKPKRGTATESRDSDFEPTPDPSDEPDF